jgi:hypothetical protein
MFVLFGYACVQNLNDKGGWPRLVPSLTNINSADGGMGSVTNMNPNATPNLLSPNDASAEYVRRGSLRVGSVSSYSKDVSAIFNSVITLGIPVVHQILIFLMLSF